MTYKADELIKVQLRVHKPVSGYTGRYSDYFVAVVGPGVQLGNEDPRIAPRCARASYKYWTKLLWLPKEKHVYFKFLIVKASTNTVVDIEEIIPHRLYIGQRPLRVEMMYNKTTTRVKEVNATFKEQLHGQLDLVEIPCLDIIRSHLALLKQAIFEVVSEATSQTEQRSVTLVSDGASSLNLCRMKEYDMNQNCQNPAKCHADSFAKIPLFEIDDAKTETKLKMSSPAEIHVQEEADNDTESNSIPPRPQEIPEQIKDNDGTDSKHKMPSLASPVRDKDAEISNANRSSFPIIANPVKWLGQKKEENNLEAKHDGPSQSRSPAQIKQDEVAASKPTSPCPAECSLQLKDGDESKDYQIKSQSPSTLAVRVKDKEHLPAKQKLQSLATFEINADEVDSRLDKPKILSTDICSHLDNNNIINPAEEPFSCCSQSKNISLPQSSAKKECKTKTSAQIAEPRAKRECIDIISSKTGMSFEMPKESSYLIKFSQNGPTADDNQPEVAENITKVKDFTEVKNKRSGQSRISNNSFTLASAGLAFASYLGYREFC